MPSRFASKMPTLASLMPTPGAGSVSSKSSRVLVRPSSPPRAGEGCSTYAVGQPPGHQSPQAAAAFRVPFSLGELRRPSPGSQAASLAEAVAGKSRRLKMLSLNGNNFSEEALAALDTILEPTGVSLGTMSDNDEDDVSEDED